MRVPVSGRCCLAQGFCARPPRWQTHCLSSVAGRTVGPYLRDWSPKTIAGRWVARVDLLRATFSSQTASARGLWGIDRPRACWRRNSCASWLMRASESRIGCCLRHLKSATTSAAVLYYEMRGGRTSRGRRTENMPVSCDILRFAFAAVSIQDMRFAATWWGIVIVWIETEAWC